MNSWIIYNKMIILIFYILTYIRNADGNESVFVLTSLIYISSAIVPHIIKSKSIKLFSVIISSIFILFCYFTVNINIILLLPVNLYEIVYFKFELKRIGILVAMIPMIFISKDMIFWYALVSSLSFLIFYISKNYSKKISLLQQQIDEMRRDSQRLSEVLSKKQEYLKQSEYTIKLEERNKLSQEIHDSIGHAITGALIQMEASKALMDIDKDKAKQLLQNSINISKKGIEDIRMHLKQIKPPKEVLGINRLKLLAEEFTSVNNIRTIVLHNGDMDKINYNHWRIIYENTVEALTNSAKYSKASRININIDILNKFIKVTIVDDGVGNNLIKKGLGIIGMEERCAAVRGNLIVDGSKGFAITMLFPIN